MRRVGVTVALAVATVAWADELDQVRARAACAEQALDAALGEGEASPACAGTLAQPVPVAVIGVDGLAASAGGFADVQRTIEKAPKKQPQPAWVLSPPYEPGKLYGVGKGATALEAFQKALVMVAAQVEAEIDAETRTEQTAETVTNKRGRVVSLTSTNRVEAVSQLLVKGVVEDVQLVGQWVDKDGTVWVLAGLDTAAIAARQDAVVRQILGLLADATERVRSGLAQDVLDQRVLFGLADAIRQVRAIGKTKLGEEAAASWKSELRDFQDLAEDVANCVEVDGVIVAGGASTPIGSNAMVRPGDRAEVTVTCRGKPLANARFRTKVQGGMAQVPGRLVTDAQGRAVLPFGEVFGSNVQVGLVHDVPGQSGSWWLDDLRPARTARIGLTAPRSATVQLDVTGGSADENGLVATMIGEAAAAQWGATVVPSGGLLTIKGKFSTGTQREVRGSIVLPSALDLSVVFTGVPGAPLLDKRIQSGGIAPTAGEARAKAVRSLGQNFGVLQLAPVLDPSVRAVLDCAFDDGATPDAAASKARGCLRYAASYAAADRDALLEVVTTRLSDGLLPLTFVDADLAALGSSAEATTLLSAVESAHDQCLALQAPASFDPWVADTVAAICEANRVMQRAVYGELSQWQAYEARIEAERKAAEAKADAEAKKVLTCRITCSEAWDRGQPADLASLIRTTYEACTIDSVQAGWLPNGCLTEGLDACMNQCVRR
jgi:hypothetical protein